MKQYISVPAFRVLFNKVRNRALKMADMTNISVSVSWANYENVGHPSINVFVHDSNKDQKVVFYECVIGYDNKEVISARINEVISRLDDIETEYRSKEFTKKLATNIRKQYTDFWKNVSSTMLKKNYHIESSLTNGMCQYANVYVIKDTTNILVNSSFFGNSISNEVQYNEFFNLNVA